jgi:DSF synthase
MHQNNHRTLSQFYDQLITEFNEEEGVMWCYMNPHPRPCFNEKILNDLNRFLQVIRNNISSDIHSGKSPSIKYVVFGSYRPGIFSLGGDLGLFVECIRQNNRNKLSNYMQLSIEVMYGIFTNMDVPLTTISLIRGNALGAGFEGALSCDYIISQEDVQLGFPEVLFNMFPGMGAYSFLARRLDPTRVEKMILGGRIYSARELHEMGLIDVLFNESDAIAEVYSFIKKLKKSHNTRKAILEIRNRVNPVTFEEMLDIGHIWVDAAMRLTDRELKTMERLMRSQDKIAKTLNHANEVVKFGVQPVK